MVGLDLRPQLRFAIGADVEDPPVLSRRREHMPRLLVAQAQGGDPGTGTQACVLAQLALFVDVDRRGLAADADVDGAIGGGDHGAHAVVAWHRQVQPRRAHPGPDLAVRGEQHAAILSFGQLLIRSHPRRPHRPRQRIARRRC